MSHTERSTSFRRATLGMAASTVLSRLTGFGRVFALAYALNFNRLTDTYNLANTTPNIVYELILGGILSATLVPVFVGRLTTDDEDDAWDAISSVVTVAAVALVVLTALFLLLSPWIIRLYTLGVSGATRADQQAVGTSLLRMFAPQILFYGLIALATALLNARRRFVAPAITPVANNLLVIAVLLLVGHLSRSSSLAELRHDRGTLWLLGLGTTAGVLLQLLLLGPSVRSARLGLRWRWDWHHPAVRRVLRLSGWTLGYVVANQISLLVVLVLANSGARGGDLSAYQGAYLFFLLPHAIVAVSVMTALLPDLSERWSTSDARGYRDRLSYGIRVTGALMIPAAAGYVVLGRPIVRLVLEHGAMSARSATTTGDVLSLFAIGLPAFSLYLLLMRAYQAMQDTRTMCLVYAVENAVNIVLALALYPRWGVQGLAVAFALAYVAGTGLAVWDLRRRAGGIDGRAVGASLGRSLAASAVMAAGVLAVSSAIGGDRGLRLLLRVGASVAAGAVLYVGAARALGVEELTALVPVPKKKA